MALTRAFPAFRSRTGTRLFRFPALGIALLLVATTGSAIELRVEGAELASIIRDSFSGSVIRLHHDPRSPAGALDSFARLGPRLGGHAVSFAIPATELRIGTMPAARFFLNDINSDPRFVRDPIGPKLFGQNVDVVSTPRSFLITLLFEDAGTEIRAVPSGRFQRLRDEAAPDVQINGISLQIALAPLNVATGNVAFGPSRVTFFGEIQAGGLANLRLFGRNVDLVNGLTGYKAKLREAIEREVKGLIDRNLPVIAANLWREIRSRGLTLGVDVSRIEWAGSTMILKGTARPR